MSATKNAATTIMLLAPQNEKARCSYCGTELAAGFYFCTACAMPHRDVEDVLPEVPPPRWDAETLIREQAPEVWRLFFTYIAVLTGCTVVTLIVFPGEQVFLPHLLVNTAGISLASLCFSIPHRSLLRPQFAGFGLASKSMVLGLVLLLALLAVNFVWHGVLWQLAPPDLKDSGAETIASVIPSRAGRIILICVFPGIFEELGFRGLMQTWLMRVLGSKRAILVSAALFSTLHLSVLSFPYLFLAGCLFGWIRLRTGLLFPAMLLHVLHNLGVLCYEGLLD